MDNGKWLGKMYQNNTFHGGFTHPALLGSEDELITWRLHALWLVFAYLHQQRSKIMSAYNNCQNLLCFMAFGLPVSAAPEISRTFQNSERFF